MERILEITLLYDFYGKLLTSRQISIFEMYYIDDLSLGEISGQLDISRQAVRDAIKKAEKQMYSYEEKLKLVDRFLKEKSIIKNIMELLDEIKIDFMDDSNDRMMKRILEMKKLANTILE